MLAGIELSSLSPLGLQNFLEQCEPKKSLGSSGITDIDIG
jgi:hypothetical protein